MRAATGRIFTYKIQYTQIRREKKRTIPPYINNNYRSQQLIAEHKVQEKKERESAFDPTPTVSAVFFCMYTYSFRDVIVVFLDFFSLYFYCIFNIKFCVDWCAVVCCTCTNKFPLL